MPELTDAEVNELVEVIDKLDPPQRRRKLSTKAALLLIFYMLRTIVPWRDLQLQMQGITYGTVYKRFRRWAQAGVFELARMQVTKTYAVGQLVRNPFAFRDMYIDTTQTKNVAGQDCTGRNSSDRGRQATKFSGICDNNKVLISCQFYPGNRADPTTLVPAVQGIVCPIHRDRRYKSTLVGDKGYVSAPNARLVARYKIKMLVPPRRNMRRQKWTMEQCAQMKRRHLIENVWCNYDKSLRLMVRVDASLVSYQAFTDLMTIKTVLKKTQHVFI